VKTDCPLIKARVRKILTFREKFFTLVLIRSQSVFWKSLQNFHCPGPGIPMSGLPIPWAGGHLHEAIVFSDGGAASRPESDRLSEYLVELAEPK
jgi:hypothetical protein